MIEKDYKLYGTKILNLKTQEIGLLICLWENKYADKTVDFATCVDKTGKRYNIELDNIRGFEDDLISNIKEAIDKKFDVVPIWNLSVSLNKTISEDSFSDFAVALDEIQKKYNILICKSAGNCKNFLYQQPTDRLVQGADSVRSLVVGSIAQAKNPYDISDIDNPSPFSRIGAGPFVYY